MKALVTGADGFVAPYLVKELISESYKVVVTHKLQVSFDMPPEVDSFYLDILDKDQVEEIFQKVVPDVIFHLAAISNVKYSKENPEITMNVNVDGTKNILEAAENIETESTVLVISSAQVYGIPKFIPITEEHPLCPENPYAESKVKVEQLAIGAAKRGQRAVIVRSFNHTGPGQTADFVCSSFAKQIVDIEKGKEPVLMVGNLTPKRDFTDVRDVVKAYVMAVNKCDAGVPYNLCSGMAYKMKDILDILLGLSNIEIEVKQDTSRVRGSDIPVLIGDNQKFCQKTGWKPKISMQESLLDILNFWRNK